MMRALLLLLAMIQEPDARLRIEGEKASVAALAVSPGALAAGGHDGSVRVWKLPSRELLLTQAGGEYAVGSMAFSPDGKSLYWTVSHEGIRKLDLETREAKTVTGSRFTGYEALSLSPDGKLLAVADKDRNLYLWSSNGDKEESAVIRGRHGATPEEGIYMTMMGRFDLHHATAFSPDGKRVCWGWESGPIGIYSLESRRAATFLPGHNDHSLAHSVVFSPDGKLLASRGFDSAVKIWELSSKKQLFERSSRGGSGLAFSPDGSLLAWGEGDGAVRFVDVVSRKGVAEIKGSTAAVTSVVFTTDGKHLITGSTMESSIRFWSMDEVRRRASSAAAPAPPTDATLLGTIDESMAYHSLAFSADGRRAAWALRGPDGELLVVDGTPAADKCPSVDGLVFSPDGRRLASTTSFADREYRVVVDGVPEATFKSIWQPIFSPDGKRIAYPVTDNEWKNCAVIDGKAGPRFNHVSSLCFSHDSLHVAYVGYDPKRQLDVVVLDGKETAAVASRIQYLVFHPDGLSVAYATYTAGGSRTQWGVIQGARFDWTGYLTFSRDGKKLAYFGVRKGTGYVVVDDRETEIPAGVIYALELSPDGRRWACSDGKRVLVDGQPGKAYDQAGAPVFSPDGKIVAYAAKEAGRWKMVVGGKSSGEYDQVSTPKFSKDGKTVSFGAREGRKVWGGVLPVE